MQVSEDLGSLKCQFSRAKIFFGVFVMVMIVPQISACQTIDKSYNARLTKSVGSKGFHFGDQLMSHGINDAMRLVWAPDGQKIAIYSLSSLEITLWDVSRNTIIWSRPALGGFFRPLTFTGDGKFLLARPSSSDGDPKAIALIAIDTSTGEAVKTIPIPNAQNSPFGKDVVDVTTSPDGKEFVITMTWTTGSGLSNSWWSIDVFRTEDWKQVTNYTANESGLFFSTKITHDSKNVVVAYSKVKTVDILQHQISKQLEIATISLDTGKLLAALSGSLAFPTEIALSPDDHYVAVASRAELAGARTRDEAYHPSLFVYDLKKGVLSSSYPNLAPSTLAVTWSKRWPIIMSIASPGQPILWDVNTAELLDRLAPSGGVSAAFNPDGTVIAYSTGSRVVLRSIEALN